MKSQPILSINNQEIYWGDALNYLRTIAEDQSFLFKISAQHLIEQEIQNRDDLQILSHDVEQAIVQLRTQNELVAPEQFEVWLKEKNMSYESLRQQIEKRLKAEKLKLEITEAKIQPFFEMNQKKLEKIVLSRIVIAQQQEAETIKTQLQENPESFGELAQKHSLTEDRYVKGIMPPIFISQLPEVAQEPVRVAPPGTMIGPFALEGGYCLLRVEQFIPVELDDTLKQQIRNQIFEQWLAEKLSQCEVKLHV
ncbi:peptidyl-prolyl cis-trans isomerase [Roseofilum sp. BLCC_M91]|uniref:peptidylprolyl isomerase n=1 Tax=Roseofilum halophilum BLCC-M91 TaxID=3022259 RepID=A0ABT7BLF8_9CYAN|nr:peptidyl-prolyl cis-trans isomerase [Roseofilum halophilum]MDJ1180030.1 peptidyl-prolyl cis-trans isomerase [Roseofilum halophilum BLCC-M91]